MLSGALGLVSTYGTRTLPQNDEMWALYDSGSGIHLSWLWHTWAEHRVPLAKLIWKSVLLLTGYDFHAGDFLTVLLMAAAAFAMVWTAKRVRGRVILADAFFPLALLNFGQAQVFLMWWQVNHVLAPVTAVAILGILVVHGNHLQLRHAAAIGGCLILFVLCGPGGLPYVLGLAFWFIVWIAMQWPSFGETQRRQSVFVLATVVVALGLLGYYFVDYKPYFPVNDPPTVSSWPPSDLRSAGMGYLQILGLSLGSATKPYAIVCGIGVLVFAAITAVVLVLMWFKRPPERWRAFGLAALFGVQCVLLAFISWSRAGMGLDYIYLGHYLTIATPALCGLYFVWEFRGGTLGRLVQFAMMIVLAVLAPLNFLQARVVGQSLQQQTAAFERDVHRGVPPSVLAEHHFASDVVPRADKLTQIIRAYKANGIGIFGQIRDDPPYHVESVPVKTAALDGAVLHDGIISAAAGSVGKSSALTFALPRVRHVYAVRFRFRYIKTADSWPMFHVYWRNSMVQEFTDTTPASMVRSFAWVVSGPDQPTWALVDGKIQVDAKVRSDRVLTVWVDAEVDQIRIYPDVLPCDFRLADIEVLGPVST
jgi:hypothetical protein